MKIHKNLLFKIFIALLVLQLIGLTGLCVLIPHACIPYNDANSPLDVTATWVHQHNATVQAWVTATAQAAPTNTP